MRSDRHRRCLIERLDNRLLMCVVPAGPQTAGAVAAWLTAPVTAAPLNAEAGQQSAVLDSTSAEAEVATPMAITPQGVAASAIRINAGGTAFTTGDGRAFSADAYFSGGTGDNTWNYAVANTTDDKLYSARRYGSFSYNVPVAAGTYSVTLHFADPKYTDSGKRTFDVTAEGATKLNDFDIAAAGGGQAAVTRTFTVTVSDGTLNLNFVKQVENPLVSALEVVPVASPPVSPPPVSPPPVSPPPPTSGVDTFTKLTWSNGANSPIVRAEALTAKTDSRLYVFGGFSGTLGPVLDSHYYTPATNSWTRIADLPQRLTHVGVTQDADNVYFVGGYVGKPGQTGYGQTYGSNKVWMYNFASNSYSALPNLPQSLAAGGAALLGRKLHYFGGQNSSRADINIHLVLDLDNLAAGWKNAAAIPHGRSHMGAVALNGKIYTVAGQIGNDGGLTTQKWVESYDPATNKWTQLAALPRAISHIASATFVMGGRIIAMGGETAHNVPSRECFAYDPGTNKWVSLTALPAAKFSGVADAIGGKIIFTTGGSAAATFIGNPG